MVNSKCCRCDGCTQWRPSDREKERVGPISAAEREREIRPCSVVYVNTCTLYVCSVHTALGLRHAGNTQSMYIHVATHLKYMVYTLVGNFPLVLKHIRP